MRDARTLYGETLAAALRDSREVLLSRVLDLDDRQWDVPRQAGINPIRWELGHVAWFGEFWVLRGSHRVADDGFVHAACAPRWTGPDAVFDSARLAHANRWSIEQESRAHLLARMAGQLDACIAAIPSHGDDADLYFHRLALMHEDMHAEAFAWLRGVLAYPAPAGCDLVALDGMGEQFVPQAEVLTGWPPSRTGFAFDNELPATPSRLRDFGIDAAPVTAGQFLRFVEDGGYDRAHLWPGQAGEWRRAFPCPHPARWRQADGGSWEMRWFDRWLDLDTSLPMVHVSAWEAEAWCRWAGRRLPSAAEWEHAANSLPSDAFLWGRSVWEWTSSPFDPYPGFAPGPYRDYSAPWFGDHRELRGGSFATHSRLHDVRYRNFFQPHRNDVFAGFRSVAS